MLKLYGTVSDNDAMTVYGKLINPLLDEWNLKNKVVIMDEDYYFKHISEYGNVRAIVITDKRLDRYYDVECYSSLQKVIVSPIFKKAELYVVGGYKLLKEAMLVADEIIINKVNTYTGKMEEYFPTIKDNKWIASEVELVTPSTKEFIYVPDDNAPNFVPSYNPKKERRRKTKQERKNFKEEKQSRPKSRRKINANNRQRGIKKY